MLDGSVRREGSVLLFRIRDPKLKLSVPVRYTGRCPIRSRPGARCWSTVNDSGSGGFVGQPNTLTTKCPSKYQAAAASY